VIGIDLGGTAIKLGRFDGEGTLLAKLEVPTPQPSVPGAVAVAIAEAVGRLDPDRLATRVGIGLPGPTDGAGRVARLAINLEGWEDVPLADWLEPELERPVILANDANCAMVGEAWRSCSPWARGWGAASGSMGRCSPGREVPPANSA
jgi:glucokinase